MVTHEFDIAAHSQRVITLVDGKISSHDAEITAFVGHAERSF